MPKTFFIDLTKCTACRGCQVACKQWNKLPAEQTIQRGTHQNPADVSVSTYKLVRFSEKEQGGKIKYVFFPDQCRHCLIPPCKEVGDGFVENAVTQDPKSGAVVFTAATAKFSDDQKQEVLESCPYNIPRYEKGKGGPMAKCTMCFDRQAEGMVPACVKSCPTGTMNFGERGDMLALAKKRLAEVKKSKPKAQLLNPEDVNVVYLVEEDPKLYHEWAVAEASLPGPMTRKQFFAKVFGPARSLA
ncbi:MAG: 4Fe-4S dicluster domain-containing protein [Thermodesulfobacteriota bacterium]